MQCFILSPSKQNKINEKMVAYSELLFYIRDLTYKIFQSRNEDIYRCRRMSCMYSNDDFVL